MTVKELIDTLSNYDGDTLVMFPDFREPVIIHSKYMVPTVNGLRKVVYIGDDSDE